LMVKWRAVSAFIDQHLAGDLAALAVQLTEFVQQNETDAALGDLLTTLGKLHRNGTLRRLGDLSDLLAGVEESVDLVALLGDVVHDADKLSVGKALQMMKSAEQAFEDAQHAGDHQDYGGWRGLLHLMSDKDVQKGLRLISILPGYLEKRIEQAQAA
ncbi:MAG: DUF1641 domain-containing protein, partial [Gammaproteobacteria bacterium]